MSRAASDRPPRSPAAGVSIREQLSGGNPRALQNVDEVVALVLARPDRVDELIRCIVEGDDQTVRMRASDALEKAVRARPALLQPHVPTLLGSMSRIDQPSVQWHVAQMLGHIPLTPRRQVQAVRILSRYLDRSTDWIVLNCSLDTMAVLARRDAGLFGLLREHLRRFEHSSYRSLSSRARKLLAEFGD
jgi:hypothetical protein